jgi:hypothetical protein
MATVLVGKNIFVTFCTRCAVGNGKLHICTHMQCLFCNLLVLLCSTGLSTVYDIQKQKDQLWSFEAPVNGVKGPFNGQMLKHHKLAQFDTAIFKLFTEIHSEWRPVTGPVIIRQAKFLWWYENNWQVLNLWGMFYMIIWKFDDSVLILPCGCKIKGILVYSVFIKTTLFVNSMLSYTFHGIKVSKTLSWPLNPF